MTDMEVKHGHHIRAPGHQAFTVKSLAGMGNPYLLPQRLGDRCLGVSRFRRLRASHSYTKWLLVLDLKKKASS